MQAQLNKLILATVLSLVTAQVLADSPAFPTPRVIVSERADTYFAQVPDFSAPEAGSGVAYRLNDDGTSEELWRVNGWYAFETSWPTTGDTWCAAGPGPWGTSQKRAIS